MLAVKHREGERTIMKRGVISTISVLGGIAVGALGAKKISGKQADYWKEMSNKHLVLFQMMNQWVKVKQERNFHCTLKQKGIKKLQYMG